MWPTGGTEEIEFEEPLADAEDLAWRQFGESDEPLSDLDDLQRRATEDWDLYFDEFRGQSPIAAPANKLRVRRVLAAVD